MQTNEELVAYLVSNGYADEHVAEAFRRNPRDKFIPPAREKFAFEDHPLPIGHGQTISAPSMVAIMTKLLEVKEGMKILEVGSGSGWQAALLAFLAGENGRVYSIERVPELFEMARRNVESLGYKNIVFVYGDGSKGYPDAQPFDRIIVTAAAPSIPAPLEEQLADGGRMLIPVGSHYWQELVLVEKAGGKTTRSSLMPVIFVPLVGEFGFRE